MIKKILSGKLLIVISLVVVAGTSAGFFATQETRDFRIAKNLDIFFSLFRELNMFYVDEVNPDKVIK
ncbi:MAG: peptidase S41, partial [Bacteroidales bacterium]|nr:peptidase S41 [Bacteroidales bacterium]